MFEKKHFIPFPASLDDRDEHLTRSQIDFPAPENNPMSRFHSKRRGHHDQKHKKNFLLIPTNDIGC